MKKTHAPFSIRRMEFESLSDRLVREAIERGEFNDLPGAGKPIPDLDKPYDAHWWVKSFLERERSTEAWVAARDAIHAKLGAVWQMQSESSVRARVHELNGQISELNEQSHREFELFNVEDVISAWKQVALARFRFRTNR